MYSSIEEAIAKMKELDARFGVGIGASKERAKIHKFLSSPLPKKQEDTPAPDPALVREERLLIQRRKEEADQNRQTRRRSRS